MLSFKFAEIEAFLEVDEDLRLEQERLLNHKMIADTLTNAYTSKRRTKNAEGYTNPWTRSR